MGCKMANDVYKMLSAIEIGIGRSLQDSEMCVLKAAYFFGRSDKHKHIIDVMKAMSKRFSKQIEEEIIRIMTSPPTKTIYG